LICSFPLTEEQQYTQNNHEEQKKSMGYTTDFDIFGIDFSKHETEPNKILGLLSSLNESTQNQLEIIELNLEQGSIERKDLVSIRYPASKVMWSPIEPSYGQDKQMFAATSDKLRLFTYSLKSGFDSPKELKNTLLNDLSAPLTSFDWSKDKNYICCSSIDTTCSIFDMNEEKFYKQLIAHDKEVMLCTF
jgi:WD repeat-containing protein 68